MIYNDLASLVQYGIKNGLISVYDKVYTTNKLLEIFMLDDYIDCESNDSPLNKILDRLCDYAYDNKLFNDDNIISRDLFDTKIMGTLTPRPSEIIERFHSLNNISPKEATDYFYKLSQDTNYIRRDRIEKDLKWTVNTEYGDLFITINLSKPEKDPKAIAAEKNAKQTGYPKCLLCTENEGYAGRINHPARQNHRIIPITINNEPWGLQYSPYVYYNEHCIVFNQSHIPMKIDRAAFNKLFDFVALFPHYMIGSNADLPIVGGSILSHEHFQGGNFNFPMAMAPIEETFKITGFEDVECGIVKWPMSVIRISCEKSSRLSELADLILNNWRNYSDEDSFIFSETNGEPHNTITPIARKKESKFELDLVLRNNITTEHHPLGVYHPHSELHHIKKENIGLIEVMGLAILPARLKIEMEQLSEMLVNSSDISSNEALIKHLEWAEKLKAKYIYFEKETVMDILKKEIGLVFESVLSHAGVYKCNENGRKAFMKFIKSIS